MTTQPQPTLTTKSVTPEGLPTSTPTAVTVAEVDTEEEREDSFAEISSAVLVNENIDAHTIFHNVTLLVNKASLLACKRHSLHISVTASM